MTTYGHKREAGDGDRRGRVVNNVHNYSHVCFPFIFVVQELATEVLIAVLAFTNRLLQLKRSAAYNLTVDYDVHAIAADSKCTRVQINHSGSRNLARLLPRRLCHFTRVLEIISGQLEIRFETKRFLTRGGGFLVLA